jgi:sec-independent protein translocase protein TatC
MSLAQHLIELRNRLFRSAIAVVLGAAAGWFLYQPVWALLEAPIKQIAQDHRAVINFTSITGAFDMQMQVAVTVGIVISSPIWLYQLFAFLVPGLTKRERKYVLGFVFTAIPLFLVGCAAGWYVFPHMTELMASFVPKGAASFYDAKYYLDFVMKLVLVVGIAFELPMFLVLLNFAGVLSGMTILKGWRWAILAVTIFTAIATPAADVASMLILAAPMIVLYFGAVGVALLRDRHSRRRAAALESSMRPREVEGAR